MLPYMAYMDPMGDETRVPNPPAICFTLHQGSDEADSEPDDDVPGPCFFSKQFEMF